MLRKAAALTLTALACCLALRAAEKGANPVELGRVKWLRDIGEGLAEAKKSGKPVLVLFQEVPG